MNRLENIILTLATAAALIVASTANADPDPCPKTGAKNDHPAVSQEDPRDGLHGIPVVKTPNSTRMARDLELEAANADSGTKPEDGLPGIPRVKTPTGTRLARDLELEEANADSGTKPEDGLPGRPVLRTPNGTRTARDLEAEQANHGKGPCPKTGRDNRDSNGTRTRAADEAGSLLHHNDGLPLDLPGTPGSPGTRTKDHELADRGAQMGALSDAANRNKNKDADGKAKTANTTLEKALERAGIDPKRLEGAKTETDDYGSTTITLEDGTVIMTGPDSDGLGSSVTKPNGDQVEVYTNGQVVKSNVKNP